MQTATVSHWPLTARSAEPELLMFKVFVECSRTTVALPSALTVILSAALTFKEDNLAFLLTEITADSALTLRLTMLELPDRSILKLPEFRLLFDENVQSSLNVIEFSDGHKPWLQVQDNRILTFERFLDFLRN